MKPLNLLTLFFLFIASSIYAQSSDAISLKGTFEQGKPQDVKVYLLKIDSPEDFYRVSYLDVIDSTEIEDDGSFVFADFGALDANYVYRLNFVKKGGNPGGTNRSYPSNNYIFVVNEGVPVTINISNSSQISRSYQLQQLDELAGNAFFQKMRDLELPIYDIVAAARPVGADPGSPIPKDSVAGVQQKMMGVVVNALIPAFETTLENATDIRRISYVMNQLSEFKPLEENVDYYRGVLNRVADQESKKPYHQAWRKTISTITSAPMVGEQAFPIKLPTAEGDSISLFDLKGKLILVDFWASWCMPCRKENRETVRPLYEEYHDKGFEVYSVSFDNSTTAWQKAVEADELSWSNVSDLLGTKASPIYKAYKLSGLPSSYLLNSNHEVLKINLRGEALRSFVAEYLKK